MPEPALKQLVLATAGHIDHGKTELTRALTGIDTDRLKEEKERGITIDIGFAHTSFGEARRLAVIDVPGHERFVKNMLAGVGGIDLALLVISADESVMPQTREHLSILGLLGVQRGVVALTKSDLVDAETLDLVRLEVAEFVHGSFLAGAPAVAVSARSGAGLEDLRQALAQAFDALEARSDRGPFRLHLDRAFSIKGFGAVITGTVVSGRIAVGDEVEILPEGLRAKVRGIEVHSAPADVARAGSRAALNLAGVDLANLRRGQQVVAPVGLYGSSSLLDVRFRLLADAPPIKDLTRVRFHLGAEEVLGRIKLLDGARSLIPGKEAFVQVRLEHALTAWPGDRFVARLYSPVATIGGGVVLDNAPDKHRGRAAEAVAALAEVAAADLAGRVALMARAARQPLGAEEVARRAGCLPADAVAAIEQASSRGELVVVPGPSTRVVAVGDWRSLMARALKLLEVYHRREPLAQGLSREELRVELQGGAVDAAVARAAIDQLSRESQVRLEGEYVALATHRVSLDAGETTLMAEIETLFRVHGLNPPTDKEVAEKWPDKRALVEKFMTMLTRGRRLAAVATGLHFHVEALAGLRRQLAPYAVSGEKLSVASFKDLTGTSRKHAIPLLEYLDRERVTRRVGDARQVIAKPQA